MIEDKKIKMGKFNFEDYRQPWETGPHWELKKEFMDEYSQMFSEDRLLCLAQAYSNIVLMHCSYPEPVMRQISHLSKPLQMRKRFQENNTSEAESSKSQQKSKRKNVYENSGKPCKLIKFCAGEDDSTVSMSPNSTILHENVMKQSSSPSSSDYCVSGNSQNPLSVPQHLETNSNGTVKGQDQISDIKPDVLLDKKFQIIDTLGLTFIQTFVQEVRKFQTKPLSAGESILAAAQKLKIFSEVNFKIYQVSGTPSHAPMFCCELSIKGCEIASDQESSKKKAKAKCVETALDILIKIASEKCMDKSIPISKPVEGFSEKAKNSDAAINSSSCSTMVEISTSPFILNQKMFDASIKDSFVLLDNISLQHATQRNVRAMLSSSASFCKKNYEYKFDENDSDSTERRVSVIIGDQVIATGTASTRDQAKVIACDKALEILKKKYYTLKVKSEYNDGYIINRNQVFEGESFSSNAITENNVGCKMLMNMGWTGGGLGTRGITEPVEAKGNNSLGRGLGYSADNCDLVKFKKRINSMLQDYSRTDTLSDLVFSKEFSKDERKEIHKMAHRYGLHTGSQGINEERFLTVRHKYTVTQILLYLMKNGGSNSKFELVDATEMSFEI